MPEPLRIRRRALLVAAGLAGSGVARAERDALEISYVIVRETLEPSGEKSTRRFENAVVLAIGETREVDIRDEYRLKVGVTNSDGQPNVQLALWDYERRGDFAGSGSAALVVGGETRLTLLATANVRYPIVLQSRRVQIP